LLYIDLDDFKKVNDTAGHDIGDLLIIEASKRIVEATRNSDLTSRVTTSKEDIAARIGGDEFMVLLASINKVDDVALICKRIIELVSQPYLIGEFELIIGTSIGVTVAPIDGEDAEMLIKNADLAMYQSKSKGKNQYQFYTDALNVSVLKKFTMESDLRAALVKNEFRLLYQPKIDFKKNRIVGVEALIRWHHAINGQIPPNKFIPVAEESNSILEIGNWVIEQGIRQVAQWREQGLGNLSVAINISAIQLQRQDVTSLIRRSLKKHQVKASQIEVEITETAIMSSEKEIIDQLQSLSDMGIKLWLDDFGTGYSSLSHLRELPIHGIKIDRMFIHELDREGSDNDIVSAIIGLVRAMNLDLIAEGVETKHQLDLLSEKGCELVQGYYFYKPMNPSDFTKLIASTRSH